MAWAQGRTMARMSQRIRVGTFVESADTIRTSAELILEGGLLLGVEDAPSLTPSERELVGTPGFINAHTHLDLGSLRGGVPPGESFLDWVGRVVAARAAMGEASLLQGVRDSADALLRSGTTAALDIDGQGQVLSCLGSHLLRVVALREVLDGSPSVPSGRTESALAALKELETEARRVGSELPAATGSPGRSGPSRWSGLSPHATHTVSDALMRAGGDLLRRTPMPHAVHFAETPEESDWLLRGQGPFSAWLEESPGVSGSQRLQRAALLRGALLIHGNVPEPDEPARIAQAGAAVVHCPGSHLFFGRPRFPIEAYREAGVEVLLGTDSWASNEALDMRREMRIARESLGLSAREAWRMATEGPARWIPSSTITGRLQPGDAADIVIFRAPWGGRVAPDAGTLAGAERVLEALTLEQPEIDRVLVAGQPAF